MRVRPLSLATAFLLLLAALPVVLPAAQAQAGDPNPAVDEWVETSILIDQPTLDRLDVTGSLILRKYVIEGTPYRSADDISDAYFQVRDADEFARANGEESNRAEAFVADIEAQATSALHDVLQTAFSDAEVTVRPARLDPSSLQAPDDLPYAPGIYLEFSATVLRDAVSYPLAKHSNSVLQAFFDLGARVDVSFEASSRAGHDVTFTLRPPGNVDGLAFEAQGDDDATSTSGRDLVVRLHNADGAQTRARTIQATLRDPAVAPTPPEDLARGARFAALIDLRDLDVTLGGAAAGDFGSILGSAAVAFDLDRIAVPDALASSLPAGVTLPLITADAIRVFHEEGLLTEEDLASFETAFLDQFEDALGDALGVQVTPTGGIDRASLAGSGALTLRASSDFALALSGGGLDPSAAIALYSQDLPLSLPRIQGYPTTYTVVLPRGIDVTEVAGASTATTVSRTDDGRSTFTHAPGEDEEPLTVTMAVTPTFVLAKFWPLVLGAVVLLVLLVGTPVALWRLRKRR